MASPRLGDSSNSRTKETATIDAPDLWQLIVGASVEASYQIDLNGLCTVCNHACTRLLGFTSENGILGKNMHQLIRHTGPDGLPYPQEKSPGWIAFQEGKSIHVIDEIAWRADGTSFPAEYWSTPITRGRDVVGCVVAIADGTIRTNAERALRDIEEQYRLIVHSIPGVIWSTDEEGNIILVSPNVEEVFGYTPDEVLALGKGFWPGRVHPEDLARVSDELEVLRANGSISDLEYRIQSKGGKWVTGHVRAIRSYENQARRYVDGIFTDLTRQRLMEEQVRHAQKMEAVGRLAGGIAHDFNNLVTIIIGYSREVLDNLRFDDPSASMIEEIQKAGERAASLTRQLLTFSRRQVLTPTVLNLIDAVTNAEEMIGRVIGDDIELIIIRGKRLGDVRADRGQIEQVLVNLALNARDALPEGGKLIVKTANIDALRSPGSEHLAISPGAYVMLAVTDTGCGMDADTQSHIFEPFFTTKDLGKGTGLGLSITYGIVTQSGGTISVESEPGVGTTFEIYLPRIEEPTGISEMSRPRYNAGRVRKKILLVEDEDALRHLIQGILQKNGYDVLLAGRPQRALSIAETYRGPIHLLLTDVLMPQMSGSELARQVTSLMPEIKVLYMSGYTNDAVLYQGRSDNSLSFLQKPFSPQGLVEKVRQVLQSETASAVLT